MVSFENTAIAFESKNDKSLHNTYRLFQLMGSQQLVSMGTPLLNFALKIRLPIQGIIRSTIFKHFCGGESIEGCNDRIQELFDYNIKTILDYSVEGKDEETDLESNKAEIIATIKRGAGDDRIPFSVFKVTGIAKFSLLHKLSKKEQLTSEEQKSFNEVKRRLNEICKEGHDAKVPVFIDAEESWIQPAIDEMVLEMMRTYNKSEVMIYNTAQLYLTDRLPYVKELIQTAKTGGFKVGLKLVRGAYMEKERERASSKGYPSPVQPDKAATDKDYDAAMNYCLENLDMVAVCCGSHNEKSTLLAVELMTKNNIKPEDKRVYFAQLLGMSDHISYNLSSAGYNVAKYVPYGPVTEVMPYLIRRAEENTSIAGQTSRELRLIRKEIKRRKGE